MPRDDTVSQQAFNAWIYVASAPLDTQQQLLTRHTDDSTAQQVREAVQSIMIRSPPAFLARALSPNAV